MMKSGTILVVRLKYKMGFLKSKLNVSCFEAYKIGLQVCVAFVIEKKYEGIDQTRKPINIRQRVSLS